MGSSNETSYFGGVKNPWDRTRVPGGAQAAVRLRWQRVCVWQRPAPTPAAPSVFSRLRCVVSGLKPTYGLVSRYGMIAFASSLDQAGPMAKSCEDMALMLNVMTGFDERDSTSLNRAKETRDLDKPLTGLKVGLPKEYFAEGLDGAVGQVVQEAVAEYWGPRLSTSASTPCYAFQFTTCRRHPRLRATCRATMACATAIALLKSTSWTCIAKAVPKVSVPRSSAES